MNILSPLFDKPHKGLGHLHADLDISHNGDVADLPIFQFANRQLRQPHQHGKLPLIQIQAFAKLPNPVTLHILNRRFKNKRGWAPPANGGEQYKRIALIFIHPPLPAVIRIGGILPGGDAVLC